MKKPAPSHCQPNKNTWLILRYLAPGLRAYWIKVLVATACLLLSVLLRILEPWPLQYVLDQVLLVRDSAQQANAVISQSNSRFSVLGLCAAALVLIAIARAMVDYYRTISFSMIGNKIISELRSRVYAHVQNLSLNFHQKSRGGDMTVRLISDLNMLKDVAVSAALPLVSSFLLLVCMIGVMLWINLRLGLIVVAIVPLFWLITARGSRKIHQSAKQQRRREGELAATAAEAFSAVRSVQAMSAQALFAGSFASSNSKSHKEGVKTARLTAGLERTVDVLIATVSGIVLWEGARMVQLGVLTPGGLVVYLAYLKRACKPLQDFAKYTGRISKAMAAGDRIAELLEQQPDIVDRPNAVVAPRLSGRIEFRGVHFGYPGKPPVIEDLNLAITAGQHLAVVGPSGVGKSTLLSLLLRLYDPTHGSIWIDGQDIKCFTVQSLRAQMSVVLQDNAVFATTVRDNITLANTHANDEEVLQAATIAMADSFIGELPQGYETILGERGVDLSQGQRQRLAIARAALRQTPILLLDEPTSSLDPDNRHKVSTALRRVAAGRTTLLVTHDMDLASRSDVVLCLGSDGRFEFGTHAELLDRDGIYASLNRKAPIQAEGEQNAVRC